MRDNQTQNLPAGDQALLWKPKRLDGISLFKARFNKFAYKKHCHREYAIGLIEQGVQKFHHLGHSYKAPATTIISVNPDEVHDGMSDCQAGYQYRMAYIRQTKIQEILTCGSELKSSSRYFNHPVVFDNQITNLFHKALVLMDDEAHNSLESHTYLVQAITLLFHRHAGRNHYLDLHLKDHRVVYQALEYIREKISENVTLDEIANAVNLSQYHFLRIFRNTTGLPPHAYLIQMRVQSAKTAIEKGYSLVEAALNAGFSDQSHMTRSFKAVHGLPPGRYKKILFS